MNRVVLYDVDQLERIPEDRQVVFFGRARAVWEVRWTKLLSGDRVAISLEAIDPHEVDPLASIYELPITRIDVSSTQLAPPEPEQDATLDPSLQ